MNPAAEYEKARLSPQKKGRARARFKHCIASTELGQADKKEQGKHWAKLYWNIVAHAFPYDEPTEKLALRGARGLDLVFVNVSGTGVFTVPSENHLCCDRAWVVAKKAQCSVKSSGMAARWSCPNPAGKRPDKEAPHEKERGIS